MPTIQVSFHKCIQDSQDYGSDDEHMVSRVFFTLTSGDESHDNLYANVKQIVGSDFESAPLEVGLAEGYEGLLNHREFRQAVEQYYRRLVGRQGSGIRLAGGATNIRMRNNTFIQPWTVEITVDDSSKAW